MYRTPDSTQGAGSSSWNFPARDPAHSPLVPFRLPTPTPSSSSSVSTSLVPPTPLDLIDPALRPPPDASRTQGVPSSRVINGKAGALVKFAEYDNKFAEIARWQDKMKAGVEARMKSMMATFKEETVKLEERHSEDIRALLERVDRMEANMHKKATSDEDESDVESVEMLAVDAAEASLAAVKDNNFLALIRNTYEHHLGVPKLTANFLPPYPETGTDWPTDPSNEERRLLRFRWDKGHDDHDNYHNILIIIDFVCKKGASYVPAAAESLAIISEDDLKARVIQKFKDLVKVVRDGKKKVKASGGVEVVAVEGESMDEESAPVVQPVLTKGKRQSRAKGKLEVRKRKRENLQGLSAEWKDSKYDAFFTDALMSDDEDEMNSAGVATGKFISRAPRYRSEELANLIKAVDSAVDPTPALKYTVRIRGEAKDYPPPSSNKLENRARRWMVDPTWLTNNKNYDVPSRIVDNGKAWGDAEDPEDILDKKQQIKQEKEETKLKVKKRMAMDNIELGKKVLAKKKRKGAAEKGNGKSNIAPVPGSSRGPGTTNYDPMQDDDDDFFAT